VDQLTVITVVLGVLIPILVAILNAYGWDATQRIWWKFAFSIIGSVMVLFLMGQFAGLKIPPLSDPFALFQFLGGTVSAVFTLAVIIFEAIGKAVTNRVLCSRGLKA
jgi:energy-coupling factor transporter transmembrane protein EcfT